MVVTLVLRMCTTSFFSFFFNDAATTEIYTLSLHDALPISSGSLVSTRVLVRSGAAFEARYASCVSRRSEEHTSELQSRRDLVCRLLLEKKKLRFPRRTSLPFALARSAVLSRFLPALSPSSI